MFCNQCGTKLKKDAKFCTNCGLAQNMKKMVEKDIEENLEKTIGIFSKKSEQVVEPPIITDVISSKPIYQEPIITYDRNYATGNNGKFGFVEAIVRFFKNYAKFSGRATRSEYWWVVLFNIIVNILLILISGLIPLLAALCSFALLIPSLSILVRRLHDVGKTGYWWLLVFLPGVGYIILLVLLLKKSVGDNKWGSVQYTNTGSNVTESDIYAIAQDHQPCYLWTPFAKLMLDRALAKVIPTYTGNENIVEMISLCNPQIISSNIATADTDTLIVVLKALGFYIELGFDINVLGNVQQNVLAVLKTRL